MRRLCTSSPWLRRVAASANLWAAWHTVRRRRGGAGVDGVTIAAFAECEALHLRRIEQALLAQTYLPGALKRVSLTKRHGRQRHIGVPCVADRVVQQALLDVLGPHFERTFCDCNYGFRTGRSAHQAVQAIATQLDAGFTWVVETDIASFFDTIDWSRLRQALAADLPDEAVLDLIHRFLRAGSLEAIAPTGRGLPQGTGISPLLANVYLTPLDRFMTAQPGRFVRYSDDLVALHRDRRAAEAGLATMQHYLDSDLRLHLHPGKTHITDVRRQGFDFLSFRFDQHGVQPDPEALARFRSRVETVVDQRRDQGHAAAIEALNPLIRGWGEYFKIADVSGLYRELDAWMLWRLGLDAQAATGLASLRAIQRRYEVQQQG